MVEHSSDKGKAEGSIPSARIARACGAPVVSATAELRGKELVYLPRVICRGGEIGRRAAFRAQWEQSHEGSTPSFGIRKNKKLWITLGIVCIKDVLYG